MDKNTADSCAKVLKSLSEYMLDAYGMRSVVEFLNSFNELCPYRIGDRVMLKHTPDITTASGWYGSRHFLVKHAPATVSTICWYPPDDKRPGEWCLGLVFDNESWIPESGENKGILQKSDRKHTYIFSLKDVQPLNQSIDELDALKKENAELRQRIKDLSRAAEGFMEAARSLTHLPLPWDPWDYEKDKLKGIE